MTNIELLKQNTYNIDKAIELFAAQNNRTVEPLQTEFEYLKWLDEGRLIVLGGGSGIGKTAYVLQLMYELVRDNQDRDDGVIGIYCSAEMTIEELTMRLIVNQLVLEGVDMRNVRKAFSSRFSDEKTFKKNVGKVKMILGDVPFYFINASRFNLGHIMDVIKAAREKNPDKRIFVAIDYLQLLLLDAEGLQDTNKAIKELKDCLVENKASAVAISALNREAFKHNRADMSAFKDTSTIEYTADIAILFAFKNAKTYTLKMSEEDREKDEIEIYAHCVKNRVGKMFSHPMLFKKSKQRFYFHDSVTEEEDAEIKKAKAKDKKDDEVIYANEMEAIL